ncbi:MAG: sugar ABC transporter substrate-binding protein [Oscillospiraceae bacterium]|nr:sugar ABC transporter substrate-binding protein [Oscillospiraceae bacterium]
MKGIKIIALALALVLCAAMLSGCGSSKEGDRTAAPAAKEKPVIDINDGAACKMAYIPMGAGQEDFAVILEGMKEAIALYPSVTLDTYDAGFNPNEQINLLNECITQGVNVIFINSMDATALNSTIASAEEAGIAVISINNGCSGVHTAHIQNTTYDAGYDAAKYIDGITDSGAKVVILDVPAELKPTCTMGQGFEDYAKDNAGSFEILEDYAQTLTSIEVGYQATSEVLTKYSDIDVLYCVNDNTAIGAAQAIEAAGRQNDGIVIWGYSGTPAALDAIAQGKITGTSYSDPFYEGYAAMVCALNYVQLGVNSNNLSNEFYANVLLPTKNVTGDNVLEIIRGTHWDMSAYNY